MVFNGMGLLQYAASEMTLAEKGISAAKVILTGFVVVFAVLLLLIAIIKLYSFIISKAQGAGDRKKNKSTVPAEKKVETTEPVISAAAAPAPAVQDGVPEEVVAVISAAVATMYGSTGKARIKSIKKSGSGRSAWANAGVLDNTRPF